MVEGGGFGEAAAPAGAAEDGEQGDTGALVGDAGERAVGRRLRRESSVARVRAAARRLRIGSGMRMRWSMVGGCVGGDRRRCRGWRR